MNEKLKGLLGGAIALALGILLAVLDPDHTMNTYLAIVSLVFGGGLLCFCCFLLIKRAPLMLLPLAIAGVLITYGVAVLTDKLSYMVLFNGFVPFAFVGIGVALALYGLYTTFKFSAVYGLTQLVFGGGLAALSLCYIFIPDFHRAFWIIAGILIAVGGGLQILLALFKKRK